MRDAPIVPRKEEYVSGMALRGSSAAMKDVPTKLSMEVYVKGMVQRQRNTSAAMRGVPTRFRKGVYVLDTEQR